jgi:hypothetical protein
MRELLIRTIVSLGAALLFLAFGIVCTFYTRWLQMIVTTGPLGPCGKSSYASMIRRLRESPYFIWHARGSGIIGLIGAGIGLYAFIANLADLMALLAR